MRKIRGFKLALRHKEIQRRAKKAGLDLGALGLGDEAALVEALGRAAAAARPAVLYDSFPAGAVEAGDPKLTSMPGLAYSLCLSTLGAEFDVFTAQEAARSSFWNLVAQAGLEEMSRFVLGLLEEEAVEERCELSPVELLADAPALAAAVERLGGHKIGVAAGPDGLRPRRSAAFSVAWLARPKSRAR